MEQEKIALGELQAVRKTFVDKETGERREYYGYEVVFENGARVRFTPLQDDRSLLRFALSEMGIK